MEIYPARQLALFALSIAWGAFSVLLFWLLDALRVTIGAYVPPPEWAGLFETELPLLHRPPLRRKRRVGAALSAVCRAVCDTVFCVVFATGEVLLLYEYNDGAMRPFALVCALVGLAVAQRATARVSVAATAYLGYGVSALRAYLAAALLLPCKGLAWLCQALLLRPLRALLRRIVSGYRKKRSAALCRAQLASAQRGFAEKE